MLWDIIRDWFVMYIWGGVASDGNHYGSFIGFFGVTDNYGEGDWADLYSDNPFIFLGEKYYPDIFNGSNMGKSTSLFISLGDWLSTTSTIVVLVILCIIFGLMVRWLFRLTSGLLQGR